MPPVFLGLEEVLEIHGDQIRRYGGSAGVRDIDLLESALAMPQAGASGQFFHGDLFEMAAAYLYHIVRNHPFLDGNKRVGTMAAFTFLKLNDLILDAPRPDFERIVLAAAEGKTDKSAIAAFLRKHSA
ncbi:MAG: type II toxin-antitoxin system death-on-curing family toxin [Armatimonadota bacterium]